MRRFLIAAALLISSNFLFNSSDAQVSISINIGNQPEWGPTGYDYVEYYYLPDLDIYYHVPDHRFYYRSGNSWHYSTTLPARYRNVDLYNMHKVVVNDKNPFQHHAVHAKDYAKFKNVHDQQPIRDIKEPKYAQSKNNWQNNRFQKPMGSPQPPHNTRQQAQVNRQPAHDNSQPSHDNITPARDNGNGRDQHHH